MRWITLPEALDLIGHGQKDALDRAFRAGDVKLRKRNKDGTTESLDPRRVDGAAEIDWDGSRLAVVEFQMFIVGGDPSPPVPPTFVQVEVDRATLLENFESRARMQSCPELYPRKGEPAGVKEWYVDRTRHVAHSTREEDLEAARQRFGRWTKDRVVVREFRGIYAPASWKEPGPKKIRRK